MTKNLYFFLEIIAKHLVSAKMDNVTIHALVLVKCIYTFICTFDLSFGCKVYGKQSLLKSKHLGNTLKRGSKVQLLVLFRHNKINVEHCSLMSSVKNQNSLLQSL